MEKQILACIIDLFFIAIQHILFKQLLGKKYKNKSILLAGWGICLVLWNMDRRLFADDRLLFAIYAWAVDFAALWVLYRGHIRAKIVLINGVVLLKAAAKGITALSFMLPGMSVKAQYFGQRKSPDIRSVISQLFFFLFVESILKIFVKQTQMKMADWLALPVVPSGSIMVCYAVWWNTGRYVGTSQIVIAVVLTLMNIHVYYIHERLHTYVMEDAKNEVLRRQNESVRMQYEKMENQWRRLRILRHNMANHYALEMGYLEKGRYDVLLEYCGEKLGEIRSPIYIVNTGNIGIDSIFNYKLDTAEKHQIRVEKEIRIEKEITISDIDLNILIGNLFDNAIEAVKGLSDDKRKLYITVNADRSTLFLRIRNPYAGRLIRDLNGNFLTHKKNKVFHGLGLREVRRVVRKYQGKMVISTDGGEFNIKVFIYMC